MSRRQPRARRDRSMAWEPFGRATAIWPADATMRDMAQKSGCTFEEVVEVMRQRCQDELWKNNRYQVAVDRAPPVAEHWPKMVHLSIKRLDRAPIHDWRDLQRIKNELIGPDNEAVELYPAEARVVDMANQYHLWVIVEPGVRFPFGWPDRMVTNQPIVGKARQRPRSETAA